MLATENSVELRDVDIIKEWNDLKKAIDRQPNIRPITVESWKRCKKSNIDPSNLQFVFLSEEELEQKLRENDYLIEVARPYMDFLSLSLAGIPHMVALLDGESWIIDIRGPVDELGGKDKGLCLGACWKEEYIGNNGGGTAISTRQPVFIYGVEHFSSVYKTFSCLGVPIFKDSKVIGAISISVLNEYAHPGRLTIAVSCVDAIEKEIEKKAKIHQSVEPSKKMIATAELMAIAVHDLKNPLASIRGLGQLGMLTSTSKRERSYFERIIKQVDSLNNSVVDLLSVFKPEKPVRINPDLIIAEIIEEMKPTCDINNIELVLITDNESDVNLHVKVFRRAMENLIKNAVQVLTNGGKIEIHINDNGDQIFISVNDNGPGIPEQIKKSLFQPFIFHRKDGTGLGLYMVQHAITEVHGGDIWFDSELGKGTTFYISLPKE
ncbi:MAG: GAF domain-containing protein [Clostridium sp.]|jgi:transcriptional regulator of acetoin/glycerol metabolism|nr:GAF domain-containing protein [Clostridium sp.]